MNSFRLKFFFIAFILAIIQYIFLDFFYIDIFLPLIIEYALFEKDKKSGIIISSLMGLIQDLSIGSFLGYNIFFKSLLFYLVYSFKEKIFLKTVFSKTLVLIIFFVLENYITLIIFKFFKISIHFPVYKQLVINLIAFPILIIILNLIEKKYLRLNES